MSTQPKFLRVLNYVTLASTFFLLFSSTQLEGQLTCEEVTEVLISAEELGYEQETVDLLKDFRIKVDQSTLRDSCRFFFYTDYIYFVRAILGEGEETTDSLLSIDALKDYPGFHLYMLSEKLYHLFDNGEMKEYHELLDSAYNYFQDYSKGNLLDPKLLGSLSMKYADVLRVDEANTVLKYIIDHTSPQDSFEIFSNFYRVAINMYNAENYLGGLEAIKEAEKYISAVDIKDMIFEFNIIYGGCLKNTDNPELAKRYFNAVIKQSDYSVYLIYAYSAILDLYENNDTLNIYKRDLEKLLTDEGSDILNSVTLSGYRSLAEVAYESGNIREHEKVLSILNGVDTADSYNLQILLQTKVENILLDKTNASDRQTYDQFLSLLRDAYDEKTSRNYNSLKLKYQTDLQVQENDKLLVEKDLKDATITSQRNYLIGGTAGIILVSILSFILYRQKEKQRSLNQEIIGQKEKIQLLNSELNHRVKNNLAFMTSLLEMQERRVEQPEAKKILRESENRMRSLSLLHSSMMHKSSSNHVSLRPYLLDIIHHLTDAYSIEENELEINTSIDDINMKAEDAMRIGLIINELITNTVKHSALEKHPPSIDITITNQKEDVLIDYRDGSDYNRVLNLQESKDPSLGLKLIHLLVDQLSGSILTHDKNLKIIFSSLV